MSKLIPVEGMSRADLDRQVKTMCYYNDPQGAALLIEDWVAQEARELQEEAERALRKDTQPAPVNLPADLQPAKPGGVRMSVKDRMELEFHGKWVAE